MKAGRLIILSSMLLAAGIAAFAYQMIALGQPPDVTFRTTAGNQLSLRELKGSPVLVTFWASDCRSCLQEMPTMEALYRRYSGRGLKIIGVAMNYDIPSRVMDLVRSGRITYPVAFDLSAELAKAFGNVSLVPNSFLIAPDGRIVFHKLGLLDMAVLDAQIEKMLLED